MRRALCSAAAIVFLFIGCSAERGRSTSGGDGGKGGASSTSTSASTGSGAGCKNGGASCLDFAECCSGSCSVGKCTQCAAAGEACSGSCCLGLNCYNNICASCRPDGQECDAFTDCCSKVCTDGYCAEVKCPAGQNPCDGACVNQQSDENNCGACGFKCQPGEDCCAASCVKTDESAAHCGSCGNACAGNQLCCGGGCLNPSGDVLNCGFCGNACSASQLCTSGICYTNPLCCNDGNNANQQPVQNQQFDQAKYLIIAWEYTPNCPMKLNDIGLYTDGGGFGVATDDNGNPGQTLCFVTSNPGAQTWRHVTCAPTVQLTANTPYWILHYTKAPTTYLSRAPSGTKVSVRISDDGASWTSAPDDYMVNTVAGDCN